MILVTGYGDLVPIEQMCAVGFRAALAKPVLKEHLHRVLSKVLTSKGVVILSTNQPPPFPQPLPIVTLAIGSVEQNLAVQEAIDNDASCKTGMGQTFRMESPK